MKTPKSDPAAARAAAEHVAIEALSFLAANPEELGRFLALSGLGPETLRRAAAEPGFLAGVLDHVAGSEPLLLAFSAHAAIPPEQVGVASRLLAGKPED